MARPNLYDLTSGTVGPPYVETVISFDTNDATPSVAAGNVFITTNSSATIITNFDDGQDGQEIEVKVDENTTIENNDNIKLDDGVSFTGVGTSFVSEINAIIKLRRFSGVWLQIAPVVIAGVAPEGGGGEGEGDTSPVVSSPSVEILRITWAQIEIPEGQAAGGGGSPVTSSVVGVGAYFTRPPESTEPSYVSWLGRSIDVNSDFCWGGSGSSGTNGNWTFATSPNTINGSWDNWGAWLASRPNRRMDITLGMQPWSGAAQLNGGDMLDEVAAGDHDSKFATWANQMAGFGLKGSASRPIYLRIGHEMEGGWFPWSARPDKAGYDYFAAAFRRIVTVLRDTQPSNNWKMVFCPSIDAYAASGLGLSYIEHVYPGDDYVDIIAGNLYDNWTGYYPPTGTLLQAQTNAWNNYHLPQLTNMNTFAEAHGKRQALGEWGVTSTISSGIERGGLDDPLFINNTYAWVTSHDFEYVIYWDQNSPPVLASLETQEVNFTQSASAYKDTFGQLSHPW